MSGNRDRAAGRSSTPSDERRRRSRSREASTPAGQTSRQYPLLPADTTRNRDPLQTRNRGQLEASGSGPGRQVPRRRPDAAPTPSRGEGEVVDFDLGDTSPSSWWKDMNLWTNFTIETEVYLTPPESAGLLSLDAVVTAYNAREGHSMMEKRPRTINPYGTVPQVGSPSWGITKWEGDLKSKCKPCHKTPLFQAASKIMISADEALSRGTYTGYTLDQLKLVAQAVIHFEPAFIDLVPPYRRSPSQQGSGLAKSILLNSPGFKGLSRPEAIDRVAGAHDVTQLVQLIHHDPDDKHYAWNFLGLILGLSQRQGPFSYVEFRQPPGSRSGEEFISWAELAVLFVGAALREWDWKVLKDAPTGIQALYQFMEKSSILGMYGGSAWKTLWVVAKGREKGVYQTLRKDNAFGRGFHKR